MQEPLQVWKLLKKHITQNMRLAFIASIIAGVMIHAPIMLRDIPNHDGLDSLYCDQNMITSGRWFLTIACGPSSYFTIPWLIGLLGIVYLSLASAFMVDFLEIKHGWAVILTSIMLVSFPTLSATFAYVFTLDGYMMGLLFAVLSVWCVKRWNNGFWLGGIFLAFSIGIYQAYLPFAALLSIYSLVMIFLSNISIKNKVSSASNYLYMGVIGATSYYLILHTLLRIQNQELSNYQGIDNLDVRAGIRLIESVKSIYMDFITFSIKGNILINNKFTAIAMVILVFIFIVTVIILWSEKKWYKNLWFYTALLFFTTGIPIASNLILLVSPNVTYHLLMRYQWVLFPICTVAFVDKYTPKKIQAMYQWILLLCSGILAFNFVVTTQIAYSNLEKKYEKTYAYCLRLLNRIEQTEGYYQGIPIAMIGVVGDEQFPMTDLTTSVTSNMIGIAGDNLLYTSTNYKLFMQAYLGATLNILPAEAMAEMYYKDAYIKMDTFPGNNSIQIIDGIMYIKTENTKR